MKRYCREGKKCSIEAAIECGAAYCCNCSNLCTGLWNALHFAVATSLVHFYRKSIYSYAHFVFVRTRTYCALKEELHESICVEGGEQGRGSRSHLGEDEKSASPATVTKNLCISRYGFIGLILDVTVDGLDENVTHIKGARYSG